MPIQYRCRCGQEVVLRPREGTYIFVGVILVFTLLNTVLTASLWLTRDSAGSLPPAQRVAERTTIDGPVDRDASAVDSHAATSRSTIATSADGGDRVSASVTPPLDIGDTSSASSNPTTRSSVPIPIESNPDGVADGSAVHRGTGDSTSQPSSGVDADEGDAAQREAPAVAAFARPASVDGFSLWMRVQHLPTATVDRAAILLAAVTWGDGFVRARAEEIVASEAGELGAWLRTWVQLPRSSEEAVIVSSDAPTGLADDLRGRWDGVWAEYPDRCSAADRRWVERARGALAEKVDYVVLIDLSESMTTETAASIRALKTIAPLIESPVGARRWAWIGFRDEVVERFELTADVDRFLESFHVWKCEGGGDVPEGVDRAIFEALKFDSFQWRTGAERRLLLIGDAPPPYDRIPSAVSLMEQAHKSPDNYVLSAVGIVREDEFTDVPSFRDLVSAGGGHVEFVREGVDPITAWWRIIGGVSAPPWGEAPVP